MEACSFPEETNLLGPPRGMSAKECDTIPVSMIVSGGGYPLTITCWKPTKAEIEEMQRTGRMWLTVFGHGMPPVYLSGFSPFVQRQDKDTSDDS